MLSPSGGFRVLHRGHRFPECLQVIYVQGTLRPAQQEAGAGLAQGSSYGGPRSGARVQFVPGDFDVLELATSMLPVEISLTGAWTQSCASWSCGRAGVYHRLVTGPVYTPRHAQRRASPGMGGADVVAVRSRLCTRRQLRCRRWLGLGPAFVAASMGV